MLIYLKVLKILYRRELLVGSISNSYFGDQCWQCGTCDTPAHLAVDLQLVPMIQAALNSEQARLVKTVNESEQDCQSALEQTVGRVDAYRLRHQPPYPQRLGHRSVQCPLTTLSVKGDTGLYVQSGSHESRIQLPLRQHRSFDIGSDDCYYFQGDKSLCSGRVQTM